MLESNRIAISLCTTYLTIIQNGLLQYINTVWHDALIFYNKVICSTAMYQKNLAFVFCIFLSFSNRSRSMKNYVSLEWDFEFHCTNDYSSSKLDIILSFSLPIQWNLFTIQKINKVHSNPISQSNIHKLDAFWKREPLH